MPRKRKIDWITRVQVFLCYRHLRNKIYPTAKRFGFARSTVSMIIQEFKDAGFSMTPRSNLSPKLLVQAQDLHIKEVLAERRKGSWVTVPKPESMLRAVLELDDQSGEDIQKKAVLLDESLMWHLRGTTAEETVIGCQNAIDDYDRKCRGLWDYVASGLEEECGLTLRSVRDWDPDDQSPCIFDKLVDRVYGITFSIPAGSTDLPSSWFRWNVDQSGRLMAGHEWAALGSPQDHESVKKGFDVFFAAHLAEYQVRVRELRGLRHDLGYISQILEHALGEDIDEGVQDGVCPECPYPERLLQLHCSA